MTVKENDERKLRNEIRLRVTKLSFSIENAGHYKENVSENAIQC